MWSGFSSEIETGIQGDTSPQVPPVACGAASHLRLKLREYILRFLIFGSRMWSGFSSEIETLSRHAIIGMSGRRMWSGFSSEIETKCVHSLAQPNCKVACGAASHLRLKHMLIIVMSSRGSLSH